MHNLRLYFFPYNGDYISEIFNFLKSISLVIPMVKGSRSHFKQRKKMFCIDTASNGEREARLLLFSSFILLDLVISGKTSNYYLLSCLHFTAYPQLLQTRIQIRCGSVDR